LLHAEDVHLHAPTLRVGTHFLLALETVRGRPKTEFLFSAEKEKVPKKHCIFSAEK